jgi:hypothetical protein
MPLPETEIQTGWIYRTSQQKERLVLGRDRDGQVVYVSKGHGEQPFINCHERSTLKEFAHRAVQKLRAIEDVRPFIAANKAQTVVVPPKRR